MRVSIYYGEPKVLQYFGNMRQNSVGPDAFAKIRWTILALYSQSATQQICLYGLEHSFGINGFRLAQFEFVKAWLPELDHIVCSSILLSNHTWSEAIHNVSVHQLPQY